MNDRALYEQDHENESDWQEYQSHSDMATEQQQQEELQQDVERVVELACRHLSPDDQNLLRWATGTQQSEPDPRQMTVLNPDSEEPPF
jgi:hypothetical protein